MIKSLRKGSLLYSVIVKNYSSHLGKILKLAKTRQNVILTQPFNYDDTKDTKKRSFLPFLYSLPSTSPGHVQVFPQPSAKGDFIECPKKSGLPSWRGLLAHAVGSELKPSSVGTIVVLFQRGKVFCCLPESKIWKWNLSNTQIIHTSFGSLRGRFLPSVC